MKQRFRHARDRVTHERMVGTGPRDQRIAEHDHGRELLVFDVALAFTAVVSMVGQRRASQRRRTRKAVANRRARNPGVAKRLARPPEIGAPGEMREHALDLGEHARVVRVCAQEAQHLVQARTARAERSSPCSSRRNSASLASAQPAP
jgi:hypothetical protein